MSTTAQQHTPTTSRIPVRTGGSGSPLIPHNTPYARLLSTSAGAGSPKSLAGADAWSPTFRDVGSPSIGYRRAGEKITSPNIVESSPSSTFRRAGGTGQQPKRTQLAFPLPGSAAQAAASEVHQPPSQQIDSSRHLPPSTPTDTDIRPLSRSESNKSIDSVILAHALGLGLASPYTGEGERFERGTEGEEGGDGERLINDELPPFLISEDGSRSRTHIPKEGGLEMNGSTGGLGVLPVQNGGRVTDTPLGSLNDGYPRTASRGQKDQSPVNQNNGGVAGHNSGTLVSQSNISDNPGPGNQHRSTGTATSARRLKPSATSAVKPAQSQKTKSLTPRSASAQELGRFASPSISSRPNHTSSPSSTTTTQSPTIPKNRNGGILNSSSTRDFSHHYPAEAYLVPQITKYGPTEGSMWDDTVIPTIAKRLHGASGPRERGRVGLGFLETENDTMQLDVRRQEERLRHGEGGEVDEDELVAEWTADGRPVKIVRVDASKAKSDDRRRPQEAESSLGGGRYSGQSVQERQEEDMSRTTMASAPQSVADVDFNGVDGSAQKGHARGGSVLSDILAEYTMEEDQVPADASARHSQAAFSDKRIGHDEEAGAVPRTTGILIAAATSQEGSTNEKAPPVTAPSSLVHQNDESYYQTQGNQIETATGSNIRNQITTVPLSETTAAVVREPSVKSKLAPSIPTGEEQHPAHISDSVQSRAIDVPLLKGGSGRNGTVPQESIELQNVGKERSTTRNRKPADMMPPTTRKSNGKMDDGHSGGCRCIIM